MGFIQTAGKRPIFSFEAKKTQKVAFCCTGLGFSYNSLCADDIPSLSNALTLYGFALDNIETGFFQRRTETTILRLFVVTEHPKSAPQSC